MYRSILLARKQAQLKLQRLKSRSSKLFSWRFSLLIIGVVAVLLFGVDYLFPPKLNRIKDVSVQVLDSKEKVLSVLATQDGRWRIPVRLKEVDPRFIKMLITFEDKRFFYHPGVDPLAMTRALFQWIKAGRVISGGSSLTMQTVRLLDPRPRTILNKIAEMIRALQLEAHFSKTEILEFYLTLAPFGGNLEGINAASQAYFNKQKPSHFTLAEAALLVAMPQSPNRLRPDVYPENAKKYRNKVLQRMFEKKVLSYKEMREAMQDKLPMVKQKFPKYARHIANEIIQGSKKESKEKELKGYRYITNIDADLQAQVEKLLKQEIPFLLPGQSIAVLVVDNKTRNILTYSGSVDFLDEERSGQINMIKAIRSPGSLLKPFIYAMAFDEGFLHPDTIVQDVPTGFSGYHPGNFKDLFHGPVTLREALKQSFNIPAVAVLEHLGPGKFYSHLRTFHINLKFEQKLTLPTLPLALGGVGMNLWDLVSLYCALANHGEFKPLNLFPKDKKEDKFDVLVSKASAWHISRILEETTAPDGFVDRNMTQADPIAYKTGTSYGHRDAWAIGYHSKYTVGVWVGRADGTSAAPCTGRSAAAPVLFKIFNLLPHSDVSKSYQIAKPDSFLSMPIKTLPPSLQFFKTKQKSKRLTYYSGASKTGEEGFHIRFPKEGSIIYVDTVATSTIPELHPINIVLSGGKPPFHCLINGHPKLVTTSHQFSWKPLALGFVELTVLDSQGQSASINIELQ